VNLLGEKRMKQLQSIQGRRKDPLLEGFQNPERPRETNPQRASVTSSTSRPESSEGIDSGAARRRIRSELLKAKT